ncbi:MAG: SAM-dependent methyltransferase, partial [Pseudomonadota bacterium]
CLAERSRKPMTRRLLGGIAAKLAERAATPDGRIAATFEVLSMTGWAPHPDQPKPLRPGSATHRLADALGTTEVPAGEKPGSSE